MRVGTNESWPSPRPRTSPGARHARRRRGGSSARAETRRCSRRAPGPQRPRRSRRASGRQPRADSSAPEHSPGHPVPTIATRMKRQPLAPAIEACEASRTARVGQRRNAADRAAAARARAPRRQSRRLRDSLAPSRHDPGTEPPHRAHTSMLLAVLGIVPALHFRPRWACPATSWRRASGQAAARGAHAHRTSPARVRARVASEHPGVRRRPRAGARPGVRAVGPLALTMYALDIPMRPSPAPGAARLRRGPRSAPTAGRPWGHAARLLRSSSRC